MLSLTVAIVAVRFFGLGGRWSATWSGSPRTTSRSACSAGCAARSIERIEPLAPAQLDGLPRKATCCRAWSRTSMPCRTCTCAGSGRRSWPCWPARSSVGRGRRVPARRGSRAGGRPARRRGRRPRARAAGSAVAPGGVRRRRAASSPPSSSSSRAARRSSSPSAPSRSRWPRARGRPRAGPASAARRPRGRRRRRRSGWSSSGLTVAGVLAVAVARLRRRPARPRADRAARAARAGLVRGGHAARRSRAASCRSTLAAGRRILELDEREAAVRDPDAPAPGAPLAVRGGARGRARHATAPASPALDGVSLRLEPGSGWRLWGPAAPARPRSSICCCASSTPRQGRVTLAGRDLREYRQEDMRRAIAVAGQDVAPVLREHPRQRPPGAARRRATARSSRRCGRARIWDWVAGLPDGLDTLVGEAGPRAVRRPAAADRAGPRAARGRAGAGARRAHGASGRSHRRRAGRDVFQRPANRGCC